jgi:CTP synthase
MIQIIVRIKCDIKYLADFESLGMAVTGINPDTKLAEIVEVKDHPYFVAVQFHPEYRSTVLNPHPLFIKFVKAAVTFNQG